MWPSHLYSIETTRPDATSPYVFKLGIRRYMFTRGSTVARTGRITNGIEDSSSE